MDFGVLEIIITVGISIIGLMFGFLNYRLGQIDNKLGEVVTKEVCFERQKRIDDKMSGATKDLNGFGKRLGIIERRA